MGLSVRFVRDTTTIDKFKAGLRGEIIQRSDPHYEEARKLYNGMIDKRPLLIARCADVAELDRAVERCYRAGQFQTDRERVEFLFRLYEQLTAPFP